jgi:hypothetical protein
MKKINQIFCLLISLFMLGCSFTQVIPEDDPYEYCPLLRYSIMEKFQSSQYDKSYIMFVHDIDNDGRADVLVTYYFDNVEFYELERFWLTGKYGYNFK